MVLRLRQGGIKYNWPIAKPGLAANLFGEFHPGFAWHLDIHNEEIGPKETGPFDGVRRIQLDRYAIAASAFKDALDESADSRVIVDRKNPFYSRIHLGWESNRCAIEDEESSYTALRSSRRWDASMSSDCQGIRIVRTKRPLQGRSQTSPWLQPRISITPSSPRR